MLKRRSFYAVGLFSAALLMTAGCATQEAVKKDAGIAPAAVAAPADQAKPTTSTPKPAAAPPAAQTVPATPPASGQQAGATAPASALQSALEKIYFDFDSSDLSESARTALSRNAAALKKAASARIRIEGNCDERGSAEYNLALGERRANAARQYLVTLGVKPERLSTISYGKEKPAVQGGDEAAMAKNRRDEFVVTAN